MTATRLPLNNLNGIITKDKVELFIERHGDGHIGEKCSCIWHIAPSNVTPEVVQLL